MTFVPELVDCGTAERDVADARSGSLGGQSRRDAGRLATLRIESVDARLIGRHQAAWSDLAARVLDHNVFLDPAFALPLLQHVRFATRPTFLLVWDSRGPLDAGRLVGLLPLAVPARGRLPLPRIARGYDHPQVALGTPLLDRERAGEVFSAMIAWVERHHAHVSGLVLTAIPTDGAFYAMLRAQSAASGRDMALLDVRKRAVLRPSRDLGTVTSILSSKRRKELRRQRRRLAETGALSYRSATTPSEIRAAAERFLMLESRGWKGRRGTALLAQVALATFTRTMTRLMAQERHCRIDSLEIDGVPIAMGIIIVADTHAHFWKTAYDERFAARSPGVQFVLELTALQEADRSVRLTDSCAIPDHPMIDRIWDGRLDIADVFIGLRTQDRGRAGAAAALRWETIRRRLRATAKDGLGALRRLKRTRIASH